jgi:hypothetical protein
MSLVGKPAWEIRFNAEWKRCALKVRNGEFNDLYTTNLDEWTCRCEAFMYNEFFLCKHLVRVYTAANDLHEVKLISRSTFIH